MVVDPVFVLPVVSGPHVVAQSSATPMIPRAVALLFAVLGSVTPAGAVTVAVFEKLSVGVGVELTVAVTV